MSRNTEELIEEVDETGKPAKKEKKGPPPTTLRELSMISQAYMLKNKRDLGAALPTVASEYNVGGIKSWIPSGNTLIDGVLGGGLPLGRITELFSVDTSEGKTTLAIHFAVQCQRAGGSVVWLESEAAMDWPRAERLGLNLENILVWGPPHLEGGFEWIQVVLENIKASKELGQKPILIVWDTISFCQAKTETEADEYAEGMMIRPRVLKKRLTRTLNKLFDSRAHLLLISQSFSSPTRFGTAIDQPGGKAPKQLSSIRIQLKRVQKMADDASPQIKTMVSTTKNKVAPPFRECAVIIDANHGYDDVMSMATYFTDKGFDDCIVDKGSGWYMLCDGQPFALPSRCRFDDIVEKMKDHPKILEYWKNRVSKLWPLPPDRKINPATGWVEPLVEEAVDGAK